MENPGKTIREKERIWRHALIRKEQRRTEEEFEYEWDWQELYNDGVFVMEKQYVDNYSLTYLPTNKGMTFGRTVMFKVELYAITGEEFHKGMTIIDYMKQKGFPITFRTWPEDTIRIPVDEWYGGIYAIDPIQ